MYQKSELAAVRSWRVNHYYSIQIKPSIFRLLLDFSGSTLTTFFLLSPSKTSQLLETTISFGGIERYCTQASRSLNICTSLIRCISNIVKREMHTTTITQIMRADVTASWAWRSRYSTVREVFRFFEVDRGGKDEDVARDGACVFGTFGKSVLSRTFSPVVGGNADCAAILCQCNLKWSRRSEETFLPANFAEVATIVECKIVSTTGIGSGRFHC